MIKIPVASNNRVANKRLADGKNKSEIKLYDGKGLTNNNNNLVHQANPRNSNINNNLE